MSNSEICKRKPLFSNKEIRQIKSLGLSLKAVEKQLALYRQGASFLRLVRPCTIKDGIVSCAPARKKELISFYEQEGGKYNVMKFVPASGAASRMFTDWFSASEKESFGSDALDKAFLQNLEEMPFFKRLNEDRRGIKLLDKGNVKDILKYILSAGGLNFGQFPKALIPFHRYPTGDVRTPLEEHICEAAGYLRGRDNVCRIHFTVAPGVRPKIVDYLRDVLKKYEKLYKVKYKISFSLQERSTDTPAVDRDNHPLKDRNGLLVFRPGGHGTLLKNLNRLDADFVFVRNIDNVAPEPLWGEITPYKKIIGGLAMQLQEAIYACLRGLESDPSNNDRIKNIVLFCRKKLNTDFPADFARQSQQAKIKFIYSVLNRPLRVCGMVENNKEPGGGPFWVEESNGVKTLQIVENAHVDKTRKDQVSIWSNAGYFNPVDMICCLKNYRGEKFNLFNYVNHDAYLISLKHEKGREIKALEVPGLWNGGMACWNTVFVEMPLIVFNPVKTVHDLLRPEHRVG